ncbi:uroporphyrinogen-III C-methyltransferase [Marinospirillum sp. MEB164]|uniref:Uroporphyrinogen-III C-methyltransferase n=1 Tax=Marinospirillum alkalitolerans TaxID=3123374 RepID=A0ABW8PWT6_9GAMM
MTHSTSSSSDASPPSARPSSTESDQPATASASHATHPSESEPSQSESIRGESNQTQPPHSQPPAAASSARGSSPAWGLLLVALLAGVGLSIALVVAWLGHQQAQQSESRLVQLEQQHQRATDESAHQLTQLNQTLAAELATQQAELVAMQRAQQQALAELHAGLSQLRQPRSVEADLREILHALRLAEQRLVLEQDRTGALFLYRRALARLQALNPPGSLSAQGQLREELEQIQAFQPVAWAELALELQELAERILEQPVLTQEALSAGLAASSSATDAEPASVWYQALWQELRSLIVIRHHTAPVQPLEDAQQVALARQQLVSLLQQAAWAALHQEAELYQSSLNRAVQRLDLYQSAPWTDWSARVTYLAAQSFEPGLPRTGQAILALESWLDEQLERTPSEADTSATEGDALPPEEAR